MRCGAGSASKTEARRRRGYGPSVLVRGGTEYVLARAPGVGMSHLPVVDGIARAHSLGKVQGGARQVEQRILARGIPRIECDADTDTDVDFGAFHDERRSGDRCELSGDRYGA